MVRVLVMGGAGLVGSHLVDRLLADGCEVIAIDDLSRGSYANVAHLKRDRRFVFREHDVATPFRADVDRIFHLALPSTRAACGVDPVRAAMTCVSGTMNALGVAAKSGARLVLGTASERWGVGVQCAESLALDFASALGPEPSVDVAEGIARTLRWFEERTGRGTRGRPSAVYGCDTPVHPPLPAPSRAGLRAG